LGPNWIHGTDDNPIFEIAKKTNTQLHYWDERQRIIDTEGNPLDTHEAEEYGRLLWENGLISQAFKHSRKNTATIDPATSLMDFFAEKAEGLFVDLEEKEAQRKRKTLLQICDFWGSYVGSPTTKQSLKFFWLEECIEGENPFVAGTYTKILKYVARPALEKAEVRLETKVSGIKGRKTEGEKVEVQVEGGDKFEFDEVVMTAPLGWLKRNKGVFVDGLTEELDTAIDAIGYGALDKVSFLSALPHPYTLTRRYRSTSPSPPPSGKPPQKNQKAPPPSQAQTHQTQQQQQHPSTNPLPHPHPPTQDLHTTSPHPTPQSQTHTAGTNKR
jgi:hypothetical protein